MPEISFDEWRALVGQTNAFLLGLGEPVERDDRGYNKPDYPAGLYAGIEPEGTCLADIAERLIKYHRQIGQDVVGRVKAGLDSFGAKLDPGRQAVSAVAVDGRAVLFFKYNANFVAAVKRLPARDRRFDRGYNGWFVATARLSDAADLLEGAGANVASVRRLAEQLGPAPHSNADSNAPDSNALAVDVWEDHGELVIKHAFDEALNAVYRVAKVYFDRDTRTRRISREYKGRPVRLAPLKARIVLEAFRARGDVKVNGIERLAEWASKYMDAIRRAPKDAREMLTAIDPAIGAAMVDLVDEMSKESAPELKSVESVLRDGITLFPYQGEGVGFIERTGYNCIIGDEMGLGKTVQAIVAAARAGLRTLVVCPASLKYNWAREIAKFTNLTGYAATTAQGDAAAICGIPGAMRGGPGGDWRSSDFTIVNGDILIDRTLSDHVVTVLLDRAPAKAAAQSAVRVRRAGKRSTSGTVQAVMCGECKSVLDAPRPESCPTCGRESGTRAVLVIRNGVGEGDRVGVEFDGDTVDGTVALCDKRRREVKSVWADALKAAGFGLIVIDESHYYKNWKAKRTKRLAEIAAGIDRRIELTGTVVKNRPVELYSQLRLVSPRLAGRFVDFATRFCGGYRDRFGFHADGATNLAELHERIKPVYLRRLKRDVLPDLPPKLHSDIPVFMDDALEARYRRAEEDFIQWLRDEGRGADAAKAKRAEHLVRMTALKQLVLAPKIEAAIEFVHNANEQGQKVVVFSGYTEVIDALTAEFGESCVRVTGSDDDTARDTAVQRFQGEDAIMVFAGNIEAAGVGLTLTASSRVLFTDEPWSPGDKQQAEDRCHRIGQDDCVNVYTLLAVNTIDETVNTVLGEKAEVIAAVQDGREAPESADTDVVDEVAARMLAARPSG